MSEYSFVKLEEIGMIEMTREESIRFSVDAYHGFRYLSIRRYIQTEGFAGATRDGVTLTPDILCALTPRILALPDELSQIKAGSLGKFAKRPGVCIVAEIGFFKGKNGLVLRQEESNGQHTEKRLWLSLSSLPEIKKLFKKSSEAFLDTGGDDF